MKEKPILFSTPMVQAILGGRKTMTRRVIKPQRMLGVWWPYDDEGLQPRYQPGDILWVRETWNKDWDGYVYKADTVTYPRREQWKPSIHMPKEAARLFLEIKSARAERLQDITDEDAFAEGMEQRLAAELGLPIEECFRIGGDVCEETFNFTQSRKAFKYLWTILNAKPKPVKSNGEITHYESFPWEDIREVREYCGKKWVVYGNPGVWAYEFGRIDFGQIEGNEL